MRARGMALAALVLLACSWSSAYAGVFIGVGIPGPYYHRYWGYGPRVLVAPASVYVAPAAVPVSVQPAPATPPAPPPPPNLPPAPIPVGN